jgi:G3E family GTPase
VSCTLRLDLLPLLEQLGGRVIVHLDPALEPETVCFALRGRDIRVEAVVTVIDRATWSGNATGDATLAEHGLGAAERDERTVAQVVVGQAEFADALVMIGAGGDPMLEAVLDRLCPLAPRQDFAALDVPALLAAIPADARRGRFDQAFGSLLYGQPPLEPVHGVSVVHFVERRPFHPMRLHHALDVLLEGVVRTRGRVWVASQPDVAMWLESAGGGLNVGNVGPWLAAVDDWSGIDAERRVRAAAQWDPYYGDRSQELVVITRSASPEEIAAALRDALVTDEELALIDELEFADPFAEWHEEMEEL